MSVGRDATLDIARGLAIVAIVVGHVGRGLGDAGLLHSGPAAALDRALYFAHLGVFVFVSGLLTPASVARHGQVSWLLQRVRLFLYLYVLWSVLQGGVRVVLSGHTNTPVSWGEILQLWVPRGHLWFLPFMAAASVVLVVARPWSPPRRWTVVVAGLVSLALWGISGPWAFTQGWALVGALLLGAAVGRHRLVQRFSSLTTSQLAALGLFTLVAYVALLASSAEPPTYALSLRSWAAVVLGALATISGVMVVLMVSALLARTTLAGTLAVLGRQSLTIYLAHILAAAGVRIALIELGIEEPALHVLLGVAAGIVLPLLLARLAPRLRLGWLLSDTPLQVRRAPALATPERGGLP